MHTAKSLKAKKLVLYFFIQQRKIQKKYIILTCILALITSLLKSWELWPIFQKNQNIYIYIYIYILMSGITNLYVKRNPIIKKVVLL
jgi:hypothetical protein